MSQLEVYLTIDRGLVTVEGGLGVKVVALGAGDPAGEEGVSTVGQLVTPALKAPDTLSCNTTVIIIIIIITIIIIIIIITAYLWSITNILRVSRNGFLLTATPC